MVYRKFMGTVVDHDPPRYRSDLIRAAMAAQGITVEELAELTHLWVGTISNARNGGNIQFDNLRLIVESLKLDMKTVVDIGREAVEVVHA
jgi:transcriptional regulator with XRE-family HTH domain